MKYTKEQRDRITAAFKGKTIEKLEYDEEENYWVMTFTDGSGACFRFMAELVN